MGTLTSCGADVALIGNYSVLLKSPASFLAGSTVSDNRAARTNGGQCRGRFTGASGGFAAVASHPEGTEPPYSWVIAKKGGSLAAQRTIIGAGSLTLDLKMGVACEATLTGSGAVNSAAVDLIVEMVASLEGSGTISAAPLQAILAMAATLEGRGEISSAALALIVDMTTTLTGSGVVTGNLSGIASLAAEITSTGEVLSTANVGAAVWAARAADNNDAGSTGELLNNAGAGANPWTTEVESGVTMLQALRVIFAAIGGKVSGAGTTTVTFRNAVVDSKNRIVATVDEDGNRSAITYDLD